MPSMLLNRLLRSCLFDQACTATHTAATLTKYVSTTTDIISKWQGLLSAGAVSDQSNAASSRGPLHTQEHMRQLMQDAIHIYRSEGAAAVLPDRITDVFMSAYSKLQTTQQQLTFFTLLAQEFGVQGAAVNAAVQTWQDKAQSQSGASPEQMYRLAEKLLAAAQPMYMQLLLPISQHKAGIAFLVRLRADLLQLMRDEPGLVQAAALRALSQDLRAALARWFSVGLVQLERITWEKTPGSLLEQVMCTEAVHRMQHLEELKRRLQQSDRRVFAFLHPSLPSEPLVVLHTAIMNNIPASMQEVLDDSSSDSGTDSSTDSTVCSKLAYSSSSSGAQDVDPAHSGTVACFYSISSGQPGLSGVDLGNFLIKKAAQLLLSELPQLQHLVTLSPTPGFRAWLITRLQQQAAAEAGGGDASSSSSSSSTSSAGTAPPHVLLEQQEVAAVLAATASSSCAGITSSVSTTPAAAAAAILLQLVTTHKWLGLPGASQAAVQSVLLRLCAVYLLRERRRGFALDPVAHFHLKNGAQLWRINSRADLSPAGLERSCGLMVNYKYVLADVSRNNQAYLVDQVIAAADQVKQLLD